ncbi:DUF1328 family protein [Natronomonas sp.]|uniref:DUF1328 family protein n=1 Tax=Natronomonas sp. TaxID=2184060 RepID=UPI002FC28721
MSTLVPILSGGSRAAVGALQLLPLQFSGNFLEWALVFIVLALVAAAVGARGIAGISMTVAKWFIIIFVVLAIISLLL